MSEVLGHSSLLTPVSGQSSLIQPVSGNDSKVQGLSGNLLITTVSGTLGTYTLLSAHGSWTPNLMGECKGTPIPSAIKSSALYKKVLASSGDIYTSNSLIKASNLGKA